MEMGERADYAPQTACAASWLAHQPSREREKREHGWVGVRQQQSEEGESKCGGEIKKRNNSKIARKK